MSDICLQFDKDSKYPPRQSLYHPHSLYPEYPWEQDEISAEPNHVYELVRECLHGLGMDVGRFNKPDWNPLGSLIHHGDTVLIKPNWVSHKNSDPAVHDDLECLVTHPSIVRAMFDYVSIALAGTGRMIIADAPMQGTDLEALFDTAGYRELISFIHQKNQNIVIADLREYHVNDKKGALSTPVETKDSAGSVLVDLGNASTHSVNDRKSLQYKVSDYLTEETLAFHSSGRHAYEINRYALEADVIINLPKPKCHRLAGMTGAMKNIVGVVYDKASLPHRAEGDAVSGSGDAYEKRSLLKQWMRGLDDRKILAERNGKPHIARFSSLVAKSYYWLSRLLTGDDYRIGGWYGNDTIWRTVVDLHRIITYADKNGHLQAVPQRKILTIGDMIVCGEKDGPIGPSPKKLGIVMASEDMVLFDRVLCRIMGFNEEKVKSVSWMIRQKDESKSVTPLLISNLKQLNNAPFDNAAYPHEWNFEPHSCWKGHIEE